MEIEQAINDRLEEIKERCDAATPGPWGCGYGYDHGTRIYLTVGNDNKDVCKDCMMGDAVFISNSREDVPYLLSRLEAAEKRAEAAVRDCGGYCATCAFVNDCSKHDNNDATNTVWYYGDCEEWEWRGEGK